jgi:hypothetical protein
MVAGMKWEGFIGWDDSETAGVLDNPYYFGLQSFDLPPTIERNKAEQATGTRSYNRSVITRKDLAGSLNFESDAETLLRFLSFGVGAGVATPLGIGDQTSWEFNPLQTGTILTPFYVREYKALTGETNGLLYGPCKMNSITLEATAGEKLIATGEFFASHPGVAAAGAHGAETFPDLQLKPFTLDELVVLDDDQGAWPPTTSVAAERISLTVLNNLVTDKRIAQASNSQYPSDLPEGKVEVTGEFDMQFDNSASYDDFIAGQEKMLKATFTGGLMTGGTNNYSLEIDLPRIVLDTHNRGGAIEGGNDRFVATIGFSALYDTTETTELRMVLQNLTTAI